MRGAAIYGSFLPCFLALNERGRSGSIIMRLMRRLYPWEKWFAFGSFRIVRGEHYHCSQSVMAGQIRVAAWRRGLLVSIDDRNDQLSVRVSRKRRINHAGRDQQRSKAERA